MCLGISDKLIDIGSNGLRSALHGGDGIALTLWPVTLAHDSPKMEPSHTGSPTAMHAGKVTAKDKDLGRPKADDMGWSDAG